MPTIAEVRQKYPQYSDLSDTDLAGALHKKFYSDMPVEQFNQKIGLTAPPAQQQPQQGGFWSEMGKAVNPLEIAKEIGRTGSEGIEKIEALKDRGKQGPIEGLMTTGGAVLGATEVPLSPLIGTARNIVGHGMTALEHLAGTAINPELAAKDELQKMYETSRGDVDLASMALRPAGLPIRGPPLLPGAPRGPYEIAASKPAYAWEAPPEPTPAPPVRPVGTAVEEAARRQGVNMPRALTSENRIVQQTGQILSKQPLAGGGQIARAVEDVPVQLAEARNRVADEFGGFRTPGNVASDIGRSVGGAAEAETQAAQAAARQADEAARANWERTTQAREQAIGGYEAQSARETGGQVGELPPTDMGQTVVDTVRASEQVARGRKDAAYRDAGSIDATVLDDAVGDVHQSVRADLASDRGGQGRVAVDREATPVARRMLRRLRAFSNDARQRAAAAVNDAIAEGGTAEDAAQTGQSMRNIEGMRQDLNFLSQGAKNDADHRAARRIINAFDDWHHGAVENSLMEGSDPGALPAMQRARAANRDWRQRFGYNDRNDADKVINKMVRGEAGQHIGPNDVSNILTATRGDKTERLLDRIYEATGDHPNHANVVQAVRGGFWNKLAGTAEGTTARSPEKISSDIYQFLHGSGRNMAGRIYSAEDQALMRRHADVLRAGVRAREDTAALARAGEPQPTEVTKGPMQELADRVIGRGQKSDEALYNTIEGYAKSKSRADVKTLANLLGRLPQELKANFVNTFIRRLGTGQKDVFSPAIFEKEWSNISPQTKSVLFGGSGPHVAALDDIAAISKHYDLVHRRFGNPSGSGQAINFVKGLGGVATAALSGSLLGPLYTAGLWLGGIGVSKFLATPAGAASLARFSKQMQRLQAAPTLPNAAAARLATRNMRNTAITLGIDTAHFPSEQRP